MVYSASREACGFNIMQPLHQAEKLVACACGQWGQQMASTISTGSAPRLFRRVFTTTDGILVIKISVPYLSIEQNHAELLVQWKISGIHVQESYILAQWPCVLHYKIPLQRGILHLPIPLGSFVPAVNFWVDRILIELLYSLLQLHVPPLF